MRILGIESSCDETAAAIVKDGKDLLASSILSSSQLHKQFGGVVPEVAAREHTMAIVPAVQTVLDEAHMELADIDGIAVTEGPGLLGALLVGMTFAKALAVALQKPLVGVHHLEAHLYANALVEPIEFPALALLVSGGHTSLFYWEKHGSLRLLGETRDDAAGEAFDKGARILGLSYPGGPEIEKLAQAADETELLVLPVAQLGRDSLDFSFSGVKTATQDLYRKHPQQKANIARALQEAVLKALVNTVARAQKQLGVQQIYLAGGVTANGRLREVFEDFGRRTGVAVHIPPPIYCTDNAAMVGALGYWELQSGRLLDKYATPRTPYNLG